MRVLIITDILQKIEQEILLSLADGGYKIWVKEASAATQAPWQSQPSSNIPALENMGAKEEVSGLEDLETEVADNVDIAQNHLMMHNDMDREVAREITEVQRDINSNVATEETGSSDHESIYSTSKTKKVCFSQNGVSVEVLKPYQHVHHLETAVQQSSNEEEPPGFGRGTKLQRIDVAQIKTSKRMNVEEASKDTHCEDGVTPLGLQSHSMLK